MWIIPISNGNRKQLRKYTWPEVTLYLCRYVIKNERKNKTLHKYWPKDMIIKRQINEDLRILLRTNFLDRFSHDRNASCREACFRRTRAIKTVTAFIH